jgi:hypothetical protein
VSIASACRAAAGNPDHVAGYRIIRRPIVGSLSACNIVVSPACCIATGMSGLFISCIPALRAAVPFVLAIAPSDLDHAQVGRKG